MQDSMKNNLARVMEKAADEAIRAERAIVDHDGARATKCLLATLALTAEAIETLAEFDGPLNALINIAPNVAVYVAALELVSKGDFEGALEAKWQRSTVAAAAAPPPGLPDHLLAPAGLDKNERRVWLSAYGSAFAYAVVSNGTSSRERALADAEHIADLAVERLRARGAR